MYLQHLGFKELLIGRHAVSIANRAIELSKSGDNSLVDAIRHLHTSEVDLAPEGYEQSERKGAWLVKAKLVPFDIHYTSPYRRAIQTARHMRLPHADWKPIPHLAERVWGPLDQISSQERDKNYPGGAMGKIEILLIGISKG